MVARELPGCLLVGCYVWVFPSQFLGYLGVVSVLGYKLSSWYDVQWLL